MTSLFHHFFQVEPPQTKTMNDDICTKQHLDLKRKKKGWSLLSTP